MVWIEAPKQDRLQHTEHPRRQVGTPHAARAVVVLAAHHRVTQGYAGGVPPCYCPSPLPGVPQTKTDHNASVIDQVFRHVTITDRTHPFFGRTFPVVRDTSSRGVAYLVVQLPNGRTRSVPIAVTDDTTETAPRSPSGGSSLPSLGRFPRISLSHHWYYRAARGGERLPTFCLSSSQLAKGSPTRSRSP